MDITTAAGVFVVGLGVVLYFAEKLVKGAVATSLSFGISTFLISVIFIGFDPENLALGVVASFEKVAGIALGSVIGAAMVAVGLAFGITALIAPMSFESAPKRVLAIPVLTEILFLALGLDGLISRTDGSVLLLGFVLSILYLVHANRQGFDIRPTGEVKETIGNKARMNRWEALSLLIVSIGALIIGSEMVIGSSRFFIKSFGLTDTVFGMTILALLVSIEELARELPAALKGRPEISYGNVAGSILAFFLFNAGIIASVRPIPVQNEILTFYLPVCIATTLLASFFMMRKRISRLGGALLVGLYVIFFAGGYVRG